MCMSCTPSLHITELLSLLVASHSYVVFSERNDVTLANNWCHNQYLPERADNSVIQSLNVAPCMESSTTSILLYKDRGYMIHIHVHYAAQKLGMNP